MKRTMKMLRTNIATCVLPDVFGTDSDENFGASFTGD